MIRFTIREMFWLTTVTALAIGWLIHTHSEQTEQQVLQMQMMDQRLAEAKDLVKQLQVFKEQDVSEETNLADANLLPAPGPGGEGAESQPAGKGLHVRIVHRRMGSEL